MTDESPRHGFSTGACAAAAAKAAAWVLAGGAPPTQIDVPFPDATRVSLGVHWARALEGAAEASVRKDAGDDPDVTHGCEVVARAVWTAAGSPEVRLRAGDGVGTVTKPGLSVSPGEPAINPVPRRMIVAAVREITERGIELTLSIPGGAELAAKTFNPRLGVVGGLSILGTTGRVRPFSLPALRQSLRCAVSVAKACGVRALVLVPGHIGQRAAEQRLPQLRSEALVEVGNEWGVVLDAVAEAAFERVLVLGHAGKLAKLPEGDWDTHSSRSASALPPVRRLALETLGEAPPADVPTVEGLFAALAAPARRVLADRLAARVAGAVQRRAGCTASVVLVTLDGTELGVAGEPDRWS